MGRGARRVVVDGAPATGASSTDDGTVASELDTAAAVDAPTDAVESTTEIVTVPSLRLDEGATAPLAVGALLEPRGVEARSRYAAGATHEATDAWYLDRAREALSTPASVVTEPPVPLYHVRCRVLGSVVGWGYTLDGHRRESWAPGDVGDFKRPVVDSAPRCFAIEV